MRVLKLIGLWKNIAKKESLRLINCRFSKYISECICLFNTTNSINILMIETRAGKYGRCLSNVIIEITKRRKKGYYREFTKELSEYCLEGRKKGMPKNRGCTYELEDIDEIDLNDPRQFAKLIKEGIHLMYQKNTARKVLEALIESLR